MAWLLSLVVFLSGAIPAQEAHASKARFRLEVIGPENAPALIQVTTREGEEAVVEIKNVGKFGLTPRFSKDARVIMLTISDRSTDAGPQVAEVEVPTNQQIVRSGTRPSFGIRLRGFRK